MNRTRHLLSTGLALALAVSLTGACDTRRPFVPPLSPQVVNIRNSFAFQANGLFGVFDDVNFRWQIDGTTATVIQTPTALLGSATVFVFDARGEQVYQRTLAENGTFTTTAGVPGTWTIHLHFADASGNVALQLEKQ